MFYRPHFCCHCGEKIIRAKWTPLTSRRFCEFCAIEQKQHDLLPRAAMVAALLFGIAGLTAYVGGGDNVPAPASDGTSKVRKLKSEATRQPNNLNSPDPYRQDLPDPSAANSSTPISNVAPANIKQPAVQRKPSTDLVYYCGAMTKKGIACTRRVKTPGRCWQHAGQPAINSLHK